MATFRSGSGWIELLRPLDPDGPIARFLAKRGEWMHHVAYAVPDLAQTLAELQAAGVRLIDSAPRSRGPRLEGGVRPPRIVPRRAHRIRRGVMFPTRRFSFRPSERPVST